MFVGLRINAPDEHIDTEEVSMELCEDTNGTEGTGSDLETKLPIFNRLAAGRNTRLACKWVWKKLHCVTFSCYKLGRVRCCQ